MPYLIDANNLIYALAEVGPEVDRDGLCELLAGLVAAGEKVCVVFDGPEQPGNCRAVSAAGIEALYSGHRLEADDLILDRIDDDTAPKRLTVVSTDKKIRTYARRRRCRTVASEQFARWLTRPRPAGPDQPREPAEKRQGLGPEQTRRWLAELELDDLDVDLPIDPLDGRSE